MAGGVKRMPKWSVTGSSNANAAKTINKAAVAGKRHYITRVDVFVSEAAVGAADITVELKDGATTVWKGIIGTGAASGTKIGFEDEDGIILTAEASLVVSAGGVGVITVLNMIGYTRGDSE